MLDVFGADALREPCPPDDMGFSGRRRDAHPHGRNRWQQNFTHGTTFGKVRPLSSRSDAG